MSLRVRSGFFLCRLIIADDFKPCEYGRADDDRVFSITPEGKLILSASTLAGNYILPPVIKEFKANYPRVELSVHTGYGYEMVERIRGGTVNLALVTARDHPFADRALVEPQELAGVLSRFSFTFSQDAK